MSEEFKYELWTEKIVEQTEVPGGPLFTNEYIDHAKSVAHGIDLAVAMDEDRNFELRDLRGAVKLTFKVVGGCVTKTTPDEVDRT